MRPWFDRAFGPWYERLYPHRSAGEAERAVTGIAGFLPRTGILDVGCGAGRHLRALLDRGYDAVGLDRSAVLLARAESDPALHGRLLRGDMRQLPVAAAGVGALLSMFTSFGYFADRDAHLDLLREFRRVVPPGGILVLDYLNATAVRSGLVPRSTRTVDGHHVVEERRIESRATDHAVVKELTISREGTVVERYREEVALYERPELETMLGETSWTVRHVRGDYDGSPWGGDSPRLLVVAEAA